MDYCNGEIEEEQKGFRNEGVGWATLYLMRGEMREVNGGGGVEVNKRVRRNSYHWE